MLTTFAKSTRLLILFLFVLMQNQLKAQILPRSKQTTICNPLNLNYRFCLDTPSRREAADPTVINFKNEYYLFASKSGGYWHSTDLIQWDFITTKDLPLEDYAPTAVIMNDTVYFMASSGNKGSKIYKTANPKTGQWQIANDSFPIALTDPDLFLDEDGRLYLYYGCSNINPIYGVELDKKTLLPIGKPVACFNSNIKAYGWERTGDYNDKNDAPWIEGSWMTKHAGKYYLQYAAPGTQFKSYCDGMYIADNPLGLFHLADNNPFSSKPDGFVSGAGHSSVFKDNYGNYWQVSTITISVKHMFEGRLALFPAFYDSMNNAYASTAYGDLPFIIPHKKINAPEELSPHWMLLSYNKPVSVSSSLDEHLSNYAADEDIRTYWSASSGNANEWISIDLQKTCTVHALQLNFAEEGTNIYGRTSYIPSRYLLQYSNDNKNWITLSDKSLNDEDAPHAYLELNVPVKARYWKIKNIHTPDGNFAISDFRIFGKGNGTLPKKVTTLHLIRNQKDRCIIKLRWDKSETTTGYTIHYGTAKDKRYHSYQVLGINTITIRNLNSLQPYYFSIDSFNENGVEKESTIFYVK